MFRFVLRAVVSLAIVAVLLTAIAAQIKTAKINTINRFMPSAYADLNDPAQIPRYLRYYRFIFLFTALKADAQAMMGFCYAQTGQWAKAGEAYQKALKLNPDLFWAYYNLALVNAHQGQYLQARESLQKASGLDFRRVLEHILASKIYMDIAADRQLTPQMLAVHLAEGYQRALAWLRLGQVDPAAGVNIF